LQQPAPDGARWNLPALCDALGRPRRKLQVALGLLRGQRIALQDRQGGLRLSRAALDAKALEALGDAYRERRAEDTAMLERMVSYAQSGSCRWKLLLEHLQSLPDRFEGCGHCDNCGRIAALAREHELRTPSPTGLQAADTITTVTPLFSVGDVVKVRRYGRGVVAAADALSVTVAFADGDQRSFMPEFVATG